MKKYILGGLVFLFPLFFLPLTQDYFVFNKFYLLIASVLALLITSAILLIVSKKFSWANKPLDIPILLFIMSVALSTIITSTNKVQALYNLNFGVGILVILGIVYFYISRFSTSLETLKGALRVTGIVLSLATIVFFFQPLKNISLSPAIDFLQNPVFTPMGGMLDLAIILGFVVVMALPGVLRPAQDDKKSKIYRLGSIILPVVALGLVVFTIVRNNLLLLPPFSISWYAVLEVMKSVKTALFGTGIDNFSAAFTSVKDLAYNQSSTWQIPAFSVSRNIPFHIITEAGLLGIVAFGFLIISAFRAVVRQAKGLLPLIYILLVSLFFPPSLTIFFLLFLRLGLIAGEVKHFHKETELADLPVVYIGAAVILLAAVAGLGYFAGRLYAGEYYFKKSIDSLISRDAKGVYDNMKTSRSINPYTERFVLNFSQTNLLIAESIAQQEAIDEQGRQTIAQAVQTAITEAKELVRLNPNKSQYFENLASVYRNIIPLAEGSEAWAISSYQRAVALDPANPALRVDLGGIYYLLGRYGEAISFFEQAVSLKPDWPNAHYNLAWSYYQNGEFDKATVAMENVTKLINKDVSPEDFQKASQELESFKKELNLPEEKTATLEPKIDLPEEAAP